MSEEPLAGGNLNPVVRVGHTVRRAAGPWTPTVHRLLRHLEAHGFPAAPRVLGFDERGREVLTFIEGTTDSSGDPAWLWTDHVLTDAARLIRWYHDLSRSFEPSPDDYWQRMVGAPAEGEVICHNDLAPFNTVFRNGLPVAFFDWDLAAPGPVLWDLAYAAWRFVPLYSSLTGCGWPTDLTERATRLRRFCDGYGLTADQRERLVDTIEQRIQCVYDTGKAWGEAGWPGWTELWQNRDHREGALQDLAYIKQHRHDLHQALT